jgi:hypothetical protein
MLAKVPAPVPSVALSAVTWNPQSRDDTPAVWLEASWKVRVYVVPGVYDAGGLTSWTLPPSFTAEPLWQSTHIPSPATA